jgi:hypothetical protein
MATPRPSRRTPFLSQAKDDDIDPSLLEGLPDVAEQPPLPFPLADAPGYEYVPESEPQPQPQPEPEPYAEGEPYAETPAGDLQLLIDTLHAEAQNALTAQFVRLAEELSARGGDAEARLAEALTTIEELRTENARLLRQIDHYDRAFQTLRSLTQDVDEAR